MITKKELKESLKICDSDNTKNKQLDLAISNAIGFVSDYLMYSLEYDASRIAEFLSSGTSFELPFTNVIAVSSVKQGEDEFDDSLVEYTGLKKLYKEGGLLKTKESIGPFVEVTYAFGYDYGENAVNPAPSGLKAVLLSIASKYYKNMGETSMGDIKSETVDGDSITFKDSILNGLTETEMNILNKYKKYGFSA